MTQVPDFETLRHERINSAAGQAVIGSFERQSASAPRPYLLVPVVMGGVGMRSGGPRGAMVDTDANPEALMRLRLALAAAARRADIQPTPEWLGNTVRQLLELYAADDAASRANGLGTSGNVSEYSVDPHLTLVMAEAPLLPRVASVLAARPLGDYAEPDADPQVEDADADIEADRPRA